MANRDKELRAFGLSLGLGLMVISTVLKLKGKTYIHLPPISLLIVLTAFIRPRVLAILKSLLERVIRIITAFITWILLVFLFYIIIAPLGIIARLFGKKFLKLGFEDIPSYFDKREKGSIVASGREADKEIYERQF